MAQPKRPTDLSALAKSIVDDATGEAPVTDPDDGKDPAGRVSEEVVLFLINERPRLPRIHDLR